MLGLLTAIDAMAIDAYVPALPAIQRDFDSSAGSVQATLAAFFVGIAVGQALWGPISDRYGRRTPLLAGLVIYIAASVAAALAPSLEFLLLSRFIQALGASSGVVLARAVVFDAWPESEAARLFTVLMQILGVTAFISPLAGGALLVWGSWRDVFWALCVVGIACLAWSAFALAESLPRQNRARTKLVAAFGDYSELLFNAPFMRAVCVSASSMAAMFAVLGASPFLFEQLGWSSSAFVMLYALTSVVFIATCQVNGLLLKRYGVARLLRWGLVTQLAAAGAFASMALMNRADAFVSAVLITVLIGVLGFVLGNATAEAMSHAPADRAGAASAVIGIAQFALSAVVLPMSTFGGSVAISMGLATFACALTAWLAASRWHASSTP